MVQTPPFGQPAPAVFSFLVAAIKGGREVWNVVESLTTCVCRLQQVLGGMRDALTAIDQILSFIATKKTRP